MEPRDTTPIDDRKHHWTESKWWRAVGWFLIVVAAIFPFPGWW